MRGVEDKLNRYLEGKLEQQQQQQQQPQPSSPKRGRKEHGAWFFIGGTDREVQPVALDPNFETKYFDQFLDHFNFVSRGSGIFSQRYLISNKFWDKGYGPIFFYTGNEGSIVEFAKNSGFLSELAEEQQALLVFAEHRYYGRSLPFGRKSFEKSYIGLLTVEQALADYAVLIVALKKQYNAGNCPVIVFGGSYGGMLSAYMRMKYPNIVTGALASSAPVLSTAGIGNPYQFFQAITENYSKFGCSC
uniref:Dipeptidyl peptidase 7 n=1 Tax=Latimeria chalumnae TaxID=7897 RepID=H3BBY1_LATCH